MRKPSDGPWTLPKKFGAYELTDRLGGGTLGELFRASRREDGLVCEVRCFPQSFGKRMLRVLEEAKAVAKLRHPNIREVYEVGREKGVFFAAMELVETRTMEDALSDAEDPLDLGRGVESLAVVARALHAAHEAGVVHGHLRPEHVLISLDADADANYVKIENFGFEKLRTASMLVASGSVDRARFLAPEQAEESSSFDARTDVYAVGAMLYRLVTGRFHVEGETIHQILRNIAEGRITPPGDVTTNLDGDVEAVILRALAVNPGDRYTTAAALAQDLDRLAHGEKPRARDMARPATKKRAARKSKLPLLLALLLLLAGGGGAAVWFVPALRAAVLGAGSGDAATSAESAGNGGAKRPDPGTAPKHEGPGGQTERQPADPGPDQPAPPPADPGAALREKVAEYLAAGEVKPAISLLTPHLEENPEDAAALAQRGHANALRDELDRAAKDLDAAKALTGGTDGPLAVTGRAVLCWKLARTAFITATRRRASIAEPVWVDLDCALQRADALPAPVDVTAFVEPWVRGSQGKVKGWAGMVEAQQVPAGLLKDYLVLTERLSEDPVPANEAAVLAAARERFPHWADPMAQEALRLRRSGAIADARTLLDQAVAADPTHPNVALAQAVFDTLDGQSGAIARGVERWAQVRGKHAHAQRMFYFCLRDRLREAGAHLDAAHCILSYLRDADPEAMRPVLLYFWTNIWRTLQSDLAAFGGAPGDAPGAEDLAFVVRNLGGAPPAELLQHAEAALAADRDGRHAAVLGMYLTRDKRGVLAPLGERLKVWRTPLERVADQFIAVAEQQASRGQFDQAIRIIKQVFTLIESDAHVRKTMRGFGMACLRSNQPQALNYFEGVLNSWANTQAHPVKPDALRWRARVQERRKDAAKAWADLDAALAAAGDRAHQVRFWRAFMAMRGGEYERAIQECDAVIQADPDRARAYLWRGLAGMHAKMGDAAAADLNTAIAKGEKDPLCRVLAALAAIEAGDNASALVHCEEAMAVSGAAISEAWWIRGRLRLAEQNENDAVTDWAEALTLRASRWGQDVPLTPLMQATMRSVGPHARTVATRVLDEAEKALAARDLRTALNWLNSLRGVRGAVNAGRQAYVWAQFQCLNGGDPMRVFQLLEQSLDAGWRHPAGWGDEPAFNRLRNAAPFKRLQARAKGN